MAEYIEREIALKTIRDNFCTYFPNVLDAVKRIPAADVQPVKCGNWNTHDVVKVLCSGETLGGFCQCTACGDVFPLFYSEHNYCPNCGARMDGDAD